MGTLWLSVRLARLFKLVRILVCPRAGTELHQIASGCLTISHIATSLINTSPIRACLIMDSTFELCFVFMYVETYPRLSILRAVAPPFVAHVIA